MQGQAQVSILGVDGLNVFLAEKHIAQDVRARMDTHSSRARLSSAGREKYMFVKCKAVGAS